MVVASPGTGGDWQREGFDMAKQASIMVLVALAAWLAMVPKRADAEPEPTGIGSCYEVAPICLYPQAPLCICDQQMRCMWVCK